jgi:hypothetical protein
MGFEEFFENNRNRLENNRDRVYQDTGRYNRNGEDSEYGNEDRAKWIDILEKVRSNKKLRLFFILAGLLLLAVVTVVIIIALPLIAKLLNFVSQNGLQGVLDELSGILDKLLKGLIV